MSDQDARRPVTIALAQAAPSPVGRDLAAFERDVRSIVGDTPGVRLVAFPELHLFGADRADLDEQNERIRRSAVPLDGDLVRELGAIAARTGVALVPGSVVEARDGGDPYNTALLFERDGSLVARYRKAFPWRPTEPYTPGTEFVVADLEGVGRVGLSICFDAWFPEVTRHLAWLGADLVVNVVKTTTPDREQEVVLARANSIVNQTFTASVNAGGPVGRGRSLVVGPEGEVLAESPDAAPAVLVSTIDLARVDAVRRDGTAGAVQPWGHARPGDPVLPLPLYGGELDPARWRLPGGTAAAATVHFPPTEGVSGS